MVSLGHNELMNDNSIHLQVINPNKVYKIVPWLDMKFENVKFIEYRKKT